MNFPQSISLTITNRCNLRCQMCGQWSAEGYLHEREDFFKHEMGLADWQRVVDELAAHQTPSLLLRGGEPFLFPGIMELIEYIHHKGIFISIDTNGTMLQKYAADLVRLGKMHLSISVDGPEAIHDQVRGVPGCFQKIKANMALLNDLQQDKTEKISTSITFTISQYSYKGLGVMPDVARDLGFSTICIVPYYYVPTEVGRKYTEELGKLGCAAFSWHGFHHEESGVEVDEFLRQFRAYQASLNGIYSYPYLPLSEAEYATWFSDPLTPVKSDACTNVEKLIDIQPNGDANFCVDFPDYVFGNVREATLEELWNSERAERFREHRRKQPFAVCYRCGSKYMSELN